MWKKFQRLMFSLILLSWGGVMLYFYTGEHLDVYLRPKFHTTVLLGGLACCVVGLFTLLTYRLETDCGHGADCSHDHEDSDMNPLVAMIIVLFPLFASVAWTEHKIDDAHMAKKSALDPDPAKFSFLEDIPPFTKETLDETRSKSKDGFYQLNLSELFYSAGDPKMVEVFSGLHFETEGMLRDEPNRNPDGKRMRLYMMYMVCCAADMTPIPISIEFEGQLPDFPNAQWVNVGGEMHYEYLDGKVFPVLKVKRIEAIETPASEQSFKW